MKAAMPELPEVEITARLIGTAVVAAPLAARGVSLPRGKVLALLATGAATKLVSSWVGIGLRWGIPKVFREYVERDPSIYEEWSHLSFGMRLMAASMGVPFLPTASLLGSDLLDRTPAQHIHCPFTDELLVAVPALVPDVALIHAKAAVVKRGRRRTT